MNELKKAAIGTAGALGIILLSSFIAAARDPVDPCEEVRQDYNEAIVAIVKGKAEQAENVDAVGALINETVARLVEQGCMPVHAPAPN